MPEAAPQFCIPADIPQRIFRAYDIRGIVDETLTHNIVYAIGLAIGSEAQAQGEKQIIVARDGRLSGPALQAALSRGLQDSGCDVIDIGAVPTPVMYFATFTLQARSGVVITGSHNPPNYNGLKIVIAGKTLAEDKIQNLYRRIVEKDLEKGVGGYSKVAVIDAYIKRVCSDIQLQKNLKVVMDCGNGIAGSTAPALLKALLAPANGELIELYCDVDGTFPNHHPDPSVPDNLRDVIAAVAEHKADIGLAFDGDGDRLGVVTSAGEIIWPDRQLMLFAKDVLARNTGATILYDVKCSKHLASVIQENGGQPLMWKTGHSLVKAKLAESGALLGGEMSGHIFFKERWYGFDDGIYTAARLLEILATDATQNKRSSSELFATIPDSVNTPELKVNIPEEEKFGYMQRLIAQAKFSNADMITIDGIRVEFADGWGLVRLSNTTPCLVLRFEADDQTALKRIMKLFRTQMLAVDSSLELPF